MEDSTKESNQCLTNDKKCTHSTESLFSLAGNLEFVCDKVTELSMHLRDAPFVDIEAMLSEVIVSCKNISGAIEKVQETAEEYLQERYNDDAKTAVPNEFHEIRNIDHDPTKRPRKLSDAEKKYLIHLGPCQPKLNTFPKIRK